MKKKTIAIFFILLVILCILLLVVSRVHKTNEKKLVFWSIQLKPIYEKEINSIIKTFESSHKDYKVVWVDIPIQEAQKRTLASVLSSTPPDIVNLNPDFSVILAQRNALHFFDIEDLEQFNKNLAGKLTYNGKIYALPFYATSPVTIYNKELYNKCIEGRFISTYDEMNKISKKLYKCASIPVFSGALNENDTLAKILNKYSISSIQTNVEKEKTYKIFSMFNDLYKSGNLSKDILAINHREVIEKYMSNQAIITVAGSNFINMIKQNALDIYSKSEIAPQLTGDNGKYDVALMNLIIPEKSKNKEAAKDFILLLTNEENQLKLSQLTNVLPANRYALQNEYFKTCSNDLVEKSRCISAKQLNNLNSFSFGEKNKKTINEEINKTLEEILLDKYSSPDSIRAKINNLSDSLKILLNN